MEGKDSSQPDIPFRAEFLGHPGVQSLRIDTHSPGEAPSRRMMSSVSTLLSGRIFQLFVLTAAVSSATYTRSTLGPLQEAMRIDLALSDNQVAVLQGLALAIPMAVGSIPLGLLVDRYPRARLFFLFALVNLVASLLTALAPSFALLFGARLLVGLSMAGILVAVYSLLADLFAPEHRGRAAMALAFGEIVGAPAAFALGGSLLTDTGAGQQPWRVAMLWLAVPLVPVALSMLALREPARTGMTVSVQKPPLREVWPRLLRARSLIAPLLLARIMVWVADGAVVIWAAPTLTRGFALSPARVGAIVGAAFLVSGILSPLIGGPLADFCQRKGGPRRTMVALATLALLSVPAALFGVTGSATFAAVLLATFLTLGYSLHLVALALGTIVIPGELRGVYLAITVTAAATFGMGVAPLAVSSLSDWIGGPPMIGRALSIVCAATSLVSAGVFAWGSRNFPAAAPGPTQPMN
ncbi:MAG: transporter [Gammaproteobacteria bacterium]|nr:transporter [Gammaproteobacteria bacterium]